MPQTHESPSAQDAGGLSGDAFPSGNCTPESNKSPTGVQEPVAALRREFVVECLRIAAVKSFHAADNLLLLDDLNAERDLRIATEHILEAARAFRELEGRP